jgi:hypothetical protein
MEAVATFLILLGIYFLGSLAFVQILIRPVRKPILDSDGSSTGCRTNHAKIFLLSFLLSLTIATIAFLNFT